MLSRTCRPIMLPCQMFRVSEMHRHPASLCSRGSKCLRMNPIITKIFGQIEAIRMIPQCPNDKDAITASTNKIFPPSALQSILLLSPQRIRLSPQQPNRNRSHSLLPWGYPRQPCKWVPVWRTVLCGDPLAPEVRWAHRALTNGSGRA